MKKIIDKKVLDDFSKNYHERFSGAERNAATNVGVLKASIDYKTLIRTPNIYSKELKPGSVTDQKKSGRCWMYASLNMIKGDFLKRHNLDDFSFSHAYLYFFDKLERSNSYLEQVISLLDRDLDDRLNHFVIFDAMEDGGWWTTFANLIEKYGMVPDYAYPDSANVEHTDILIEMLQKRLRKAAKDIRAAYSEGKNESDLLKIKDRCIEDIYKICAVSLGIPPKSFDLILRDKDKKIIEKRNMTPKEFYDDYISEDLNEYIEISDYPIEKIKYNHLYELTYLKALIGKRPINYISIPTERIKEITKAMIDDGISVWFAADVGQDSLIGRDNEGNGTLGLGLVNTDALFRMDSDMSKGDSLKTLHCYPTHAMVIQGYDDEGIMPRWKVENSWGEKSGNKGYLAMDDAWFDKYVFEIVTKKSYLNDEEKKALDKEPIKIMPWEFA